MSRGSLWFILQGIVFVGIPTGLYFLEMWIRKRKRGL